MVKITLSQKKVYIAASAAALTFLILWLFIYLPKQKQFDLLESRVKEIKAQIQQVEQFLTRDQKEERGVVLDDGKRREFKLADKEEESLRMLPDVADKFNLQISSLRAQPKAVLLDENQQPLEIEGKICQKVAVVIEMTGRYENLVNYIASLKKTLPTYSTVERVSLRPADPSKQTLTVSLEMNLYLLS